MVVKINSSFGVHFTHDDSDGVGCALVTRYIQNVVNFDVVPEKVYPHMNSINMNKYIIGRYVPIMKQFLDGNHVSADDVLFFFNQTPQNFQTELMNTIDIPKYIFISDVPLDEDMADILEYCRVKYGIVPRYTDHHGTMEYLHGKYDWIFVQQTDENGTLTSAAKHLRDRLFKESGPKDIYISNSIPKEEPSWSYILTDLIDDISRYDTWLWKTEPRNFDENLTTAIIQYYCSAQTAFDVICEKLDCVKSVKSLKDIELFRFINETNEIVMEKSINTALYNYHTCKGSELGWVGDEADKTVAIFISPDVASNAASEAVYLDNDAVDIVLSISPAQRKLGFRCSQTKDINLGEIAKRYYNGGGHPKAAGAVVGIDEFIKILSLYYYLEDGKGKKNEDLSIL